MGKSSIKGFTIATAQMLSLAWSLYRHIWGPPTPGLGRRWPRACRSIAGRGCHTPRAAWRNRSPDTRASLPKACPEPRISQGSHSGPIVIAGWFVVCFIPCPVKIPVLRWNTPKRKPGLVLDLHLKFFIFLGERNLGGVTVQSAASPLTPSRSSTGNAGDHTQQDRQGGWQPSTFLVDPRKVRDPWPQCGADGWAAGCWSHDESPNLGVDL